MDSEDKQVKDDNENQPLLGGNPDVNSQENICVKHAKNIIIVVVILLITLFFIGLTFLLTFLLQPAYVPNPSNQTDLTILSLSVWGSPHKDDKEERISAIAEYIKSHNESYDVVILQELWMRPDHSTIKDSLAGTGYRMTDVGDLAPSTCDGRVLPSFCSGLALLSKLEIKEIEYNPYSVHGDFFWSDGEYFARKGVGRVRVAPSENVTVDIFLTSLAANDYNYYYRQIQAKEFGAAMRNSDADYVTGGGNFEVDPRTSETSYRDIRSGLHDSRQDFLGDHWMDNDLATYGNKKNSYSGRDGPLLYDYLLHKSNHHKKIKVTNYNVIVLKTSSGKSFSNHEAISVKYSLQ